MNENVDLLPMTLARRPWASKLRQASQQEQEIARRRADPANKDRLGYTEEEVIAAVDENPDDKPCCLPRSAK